MGEIKRRLPTLCCYYRKTFQRTWSLLQTEAIFINLHMNICFTSFITTTSHKCQSNSNDRQLDCLFNSFSGKQWRNNQSYASLAICGGTHQRHVDSPRRDGNVECISTPWCHRAISNKCYPAFHDMDTRKRYLCWFLIAICTVALSLNHLWQSPGYLGYLTKSLHVIEPLHFKAFPPGKWYMMGHREFYDKHDFIP